ncbi:uncharacterized protein LOC127866415 [Dreissena polymorpha]|uniref:BZIP domain-containing protein n=1 Tax=Dreissena polymorpha TaxID=45954 RepID=A0A9D4LUF1_DREPO|nr:uncharacterized protein LOC127866415 [Dreissena polymorpha]KAH3863066.1 hypothetical protein DPMN_026043 [Dreissena polymorpha]
MMRMDLFNDSMEFRQQSCFLDDMLGLSADTFAADLGSESSILDLDLDGPLKPLESRHRDVQQSLEDFLLPEPAGDPLGDDWMESVDIRSFLDTDKSFEEQPTLTTKSFEEQPTLTTPVVVQPSVLQQMSQVITYTTSKEDDEPRKEGMKLAAFELLKTLLTENWALKNAVAVAKVEPVVNIQPPTPKVSISSATSPIAQVPNIDFSSFLEESITYDVHLEDDVQNSIHDFIEMPEDAPMIASIELQDFNIKAEPLTVNNPTFLDEPNSFLSSSSVADESDNLSTIDTSYFSDDSNISSVKSSQVSEKDFTKLKSKRKSRSSTYDSEYEHVSDKKVRKKMQNKNAATRYREKKRAEKETIQEQEARLADKNKELRERVDSIQREIKYMKELINDINKAKKHCT